MKDLRELKDQIHGYDARTVDWVIQIFEYLFTNKSFNFKLITSRGLWAAAIQKDHEIYEVARVVLQAFLNDLLHQMQDPETPDSQLELNEILIGHILCIYAYSEPLEGTVLKVPTKTEQGWESVRYRVSRLQLTSKLISAPYFAYGLATQHPEVPSLLLFMGTNPLPVANGGRMTRLADFVPQYNVGHPLYWMGQDVLADWIQNQVQRGRGVDAYGISLGGSLALLAHVHHPDCVRAFAYAPTAFLKYVQKMYAKKLNNLNLDPPSNAIWIYTHKGDHVSWLGHWFPENAKIFQLKVSEKYAPLESHVKVFANHPNVQVTPMNVQKLNRQLRQAWITPLWHCSAPLLFSYNLGNVAVKSAWRIPVYGVGERMIQPVFTGLYRCCFGRKENEGKEWEEKERDSLELHRSPIFSESPEMIWDPLFQSWEESLLFEDWREEGETDVESPSSGTKWNLPPKGTLSPKG